MDRKPKRERQRCEVWTRCVGYYRPTRNMNAGKRAEVADRKQFVVPADEAPAERGAA